MNIVVGITGGIAAYKAVSVVRGARARRPRRPGGRDGGRAAVRRAADARGDQPQSRAHRALRGRRRGAARGDRAGRRPDRRRSGDREHDRARSRSGSPTTCWATRSSPRARRCCSPRRCTPRCGRTPPRMANVADLAVARGALRRAGQRPADRLRLRPGADGGARGHHRRCPGAAGEHVGQAREPTRPVGGDLAGAASWSPPAARANRSTRSASSATARAASRASPSPGRRRPGARRHADRAPTSRRRARPAARRRSGCEHVSTTLELQEAALLAAANGRGRSSWPRPSPTTGPETVADARSRRRPRATPSNLRLVKNPDILRELAAGADGQVIVGFAAETEPDPDALLALGVRQSASERASTSSSSTGSAGRRASPRTTTR